MKLSLRRNKILIIILGLFLILGLSLYQGGIKNFFYSFSGPVQKLLWKAGQKVSNSLETVFRINNLSQEVNHLESENQKLLFEIVSLEDLKRENETLRRALELDLQKELKITLAEIISKDINEDSILINKGEEAGVSRDMAVINESRVLLGKISEVHKNFSRVMLISNKKSSLDVKIQHKEVQGIVRGRGNLSLFLGLVPQDKEISRGDLIITTSLSGLPKNLLVGRVETIRKSDVSPIQEADVSPFFDLSLLEKIFIVLDF